MADFTWFAVQTTDHNGRWFTDYECLGIADALLYQREIEYRDGIPCRLIQIDRAGNRVLAPTDAWDKTYDETRRLVFDALRNVDAKQYDAHVWAWLDYLCCNANAMRDRIANR